MTALRQIAAGYLAMRRSLGYQMTGQGRLLMDYISYLEDTGQITVTAANAVSWAIRPSGTSPVWHSRRLSVVRCFARHLSAFDPACQVPPADLLPVRNSRAAPYIYSEDEICALIHAAGTLARPLHAASCQAVISLLAASGMRIGEAVKLTRHDADQAQITTPPGQRRPRIHDLRHTFTVVTLRDWYRDGVDVQARLPVLSAMLGHVAPAATYWHLTATPDLLALAAQRLHQHLGELP